ncbi:hypothetical protein QPK14_02015 [Photorhabdus temperata subsp. temperata]|uniref:EF-hand domain-containing protein n=1 Tax=Photorhabdus temperata J3 TaxID=1389415 RepID=U7QV63_PHOTE|nr:hypothetical protein [Photorhabdus temperata]ERT11172.1 hypothetical protein O185_20835 [Photorhabdus temperata J3]
MSKMKNYTPKHYVVKKIEDMSITTQIDSLDQAIYYPNSVTIHAAPRGSKLKDGSESKFGHVFMTVTGFNDNTDRFESITIGLSIGDSVWTPKDNISYNDRIDYPEASSLTIISGNYPHYQNVTRLYQTVKDYKEGKIKPPDYHIGAFNCIHFVKELAKNAGINLSLSSTPNSVAEYIKHIADGYRTPIVIDLNGDGVKTISIDSGIEFDFGGNGDKTKTGWVNENDGLLVIDKNNDGIINNGSELFGEETILSSGKKAKNGFEALLDLDSNKDGVLDANDLLWSSLKIWQDKNQDAYTDQGELKSMEEVGIESINLDYGEIEHFDSEGNYHGLASSVNWSDGRNTDIIDVWFKQGENRNYSQDNEINKLINQRENFTAKNEDIIPENIQNDLIQPQNIPVNNLGQYHEVYYFDDGFIGF